MPRESLAGATPVLARKIVGTRGAFQPLIVVRTHFERFNNVWNDRESVLKSTFARLERIQFLIPERSVSDWRTRAVFKTGGLDDRAGKLLTAMLRDFLGGWQFLVRLLAQGEMPNDPRIQRNAQRVLQIPIGKFLLAQKYCHRVRRRGRAGDHREILKRPPVRLAVGVNRAVVIHAHNKIALPFPAQLRQKQPRELRRGKDLRQPGT